MPLIPARKPDAPRLPWGRTCRNLVAGEAALCALAPSLSVTALAAPPPPPVCRGTDLMTGLEQTNPKLHARVIRQIATVANGEAMLWRITGGPQEAAGSGGGKESWLFGTIHLTDPRVHRLSPAVVGALAASKTLALEVDDLNPEVLRKALDANAAILTSTDARRLDRQLEPLELEHLKAAAAAKGVPATRAQTMRPWLLTTFLAVPACEAAREAAGLKPLDTALRDRALANGARIVGLESISGQLQAMAALPADTELAWLRASLAIYPRIEDTTETLVQLYLRRRIGATWELWQAFAGDHALAPGQLRQLKEMMTGRRNRQMRDAAAPLLAAGGVFIAVGALHLPGADGLVQLLRDQGFAVTAVE